jgi:tripartite-type tricarboxylate transporter receptor subunit TctC
VREIEVIRKSIFAMAALAVAAMASLSSTQDAAAQGATNYPTKPIRIIVAFPPGNGSDIIARLIAEHMTKTIGQPVIVENKPGGDTMIGAAAAAEAAPDGYTLLFVGNSLCCVAPVLNKAPYDPIKSFDPILQTTTAPWALVTSTKAPFGSAEELIKAAKAAPGKLTYGSDSLSSRLVAMLFNKAAGIEMRHIPFKGSAAAANDIANREVDILWTAAGNVRAQVEGGQIKLIAYSATEPSELAPGIPLVSKTLSGFSFYTWTGISAPAGTPKPIIDKLNTHIQAAIDDKAVFDRIFLLGQTKPVTRTPSGFAEIIARDVVRWKELIIEAGIK